MEEDNSRAEYDIMGEEISMFFKKAFDATHVNNNFRVGRISSWEGQARRDLKKEIFQYQRQEQHSGISLFHTWAEVAGGWKAYDKRSPHPHL